MPGFILLLTIGLLVFLAALTGYTAWVLTHPPRRTYASALAKGKPGDPGELPPGPRGPRTWSAWMLAWRGLQLPVWDLAGDDPSGPVFVLSHGWGDSRIGGLTRAAYLLPLASRVILWDMPGHGEAPGVCTLGTREPEALRALIERVGCAAPIVLYGWSLGAGVSIACAAMPDGPPPGLLPRIGGVVAEAPYRLAATPARNVLESWALPWRINLPLALGLLGMRFGVGWTWRGFDRLEHAGRLRVPLLVLHGVEDAISPVQDGRDLVRAAALGRMVELPAGHHGIWTDPATAETAAAAARGFVATMADARTPDG
ncbi:MAG: hypothetical protein HBSAPP03_03960 [Phycisphaerae bacterium]|nr:MAG: hypothetical protein HBSAPP03_03960 [Phycisphaerae bacterium]